jgi:hypothetical protein
MLDEGAQVTQNTRLTDINLEETIVALGDTLHLAADADLDAIVRRVLRQRDGVLVRNLHIQSRTRVSAPPAAAWQERMWSQRAV